MNAEERAAQYLNQNGFLALFLQGPKLVQAFKEVERSAIQRTREAIRDAIIERKNRLQFIARAEGWDVSKEVHELEKSSQLAMAAQVKDK